jgi:DNA topoisomerase-2
MKGKILNVRGEATKKISENKEITEIKQILGLKMGKQYTAEDAAKTLRYGKVLFMTDQDLDGSHIKGLGLNLFQSEWPSLAEIPGFIGFMNTPILKANKCATTLMFYNDGEYNEWKTSIADISSWKIKYYKGLGTSTGKEFREYFQQKKIVGFQHNGLPSSDAIDMVFNKKRADDRKKWLDGYNRESFLDTNQSLVTYESFIHRELIHFSKYDCDRSIPNLMDGLKTSLRKILFAAFKKNLNNEIKVAQFSGYVSENACYHHGEASLNGAIVGMAQNFVGSNNINLLLPLGQFGSRLQGGNDSASERYIFTQLNSLTRRLFPQVDDHILQYLNDDGTLVEPLFYAPIIPMILVNGSKGIGTGFSTDVMCYNPMDVIKYLLFKLEHPYDVAINSEPLTPYYEGFRGTITHTGDQRFLFKGIYEVICPDKIRVTELPVGFWTQDFKELLETLVDPPANKEGVKLPSVIRDFDDMSKDTTVDFTITFTKGKLEELEHSKQDNECNGVHKLLKLYTTNSTSNMHLFDASDKLKKYATVFEIMDDYFVTRLQLYQTRKDFLVNSIQRELCVLSNKAKYLEEVLNGAVDLRRKTRTEVGEMLLMRGYDVVDGDSDYKYLTKMPMDSVTTENVTKTIRDFQNKEAELEIVKITSNNEMWIQELSLLTSEYLHYKEGRERLQSCDDGKSAGKKRVQSKMTAPQVNKKVKPLEKVVIDLV